MALALLRPGTSWDLSYFFHEQKALRAVPGSQTHSIPTTVCPGNTQRGDNSGLSEAWYFARLEWSVGGPYLLFYTTAMADRPYNILSLRVACFQWMTPWELKSSTHPQKRASKGAARCLTPHPYCSHLHPKTTSTHNSAEPAGASMTYTMTEGWQSPISTSPWHSSAFPPASWAIPNRRTLWSHPLILQGHVKKHFWNPKASMF